MNQLRKLFFLTGCILLILSGCRSLQQEVSVSDEKMFRNLDALEEELIRLRGRKPSQKELEAVQKQASELSGVSLNHQYTARLEALTGLSYWLDGNTRRAGSHLVTAKDAWEMDEVTILLEALLTDDADKRIDFLSQKTEDSSWRLKSERAAALYETGRYGEAVVLWDESLPHLSKAYNDLYREQRERAWALRGSDLQSELALSLDESPVQLRMMVEITRKESLLMQNAEEFKEEQMFTWLQNNLYLPPGRDPDDTALRSDAAMFLWRLIAEKISDMSILTRFSSRFTDQSPVEDLAPDDPWFDGALGCVQTEIMGLPDGARFYPEEPVSGLDYIGWLKAADDY